MTNPIHLDADWILLPLAVVGIAWLAMNVRKHRLDAKNEPWPQRDEGGAYHWPDGRTTRDREGLELIGRWKDPD